MWSHAAVSSVRSDRPCDRRAAASDELCRGAPPQDSRPGGPAPARATPPGCERAARDDAVAPRCCCPGCHGSTHQPEVGPAPPEVRRDVQQKSSRKGATSITKSLDPPAPVTPEGWRWTGHLGSPGQAAETLINSTSDIYTLISQLNRILCDIIIFAHQ